MFGNKDGLISKPNIRLGKARRFRSAPTQKIPDNYGKIRRVLSVDRLGLKTKFKSCLPEGKI